jgi:rhodanese-related sulfurtransferase
MTATSGTYAGDLTPQEAWSLLESDKGAQLVDVRTAAEWTFVGLPDLSGLGRQVVCVEWQSLPAMALNPDFVGDVKHEAPGLAKTDTPILFLCRSGARSRSAAMAMTAAGYSRAYNIAGGFEGDLDAQRHRAGINGWKAAKLPWRQT